MHARLKESDHSILIGEHHFVGKDAIGIRHHTSSVKQILLAGFVLSSKSELLEVRQGTVRMCGGSYHSQSGIIQMKGRLLNRRLFLFVLSSGLRSRGVSLTSTRLRLFGGKKSAIEINSSIWWEEIGNRNRPKSTRRFGGKK